MKKISELFEAMLDGKVFIKRCSGTKIFYDADTGEFYYTQGNGICLILKWDWIKYDFQKFIDNWEEERGWYNNIPESGIWCWTWDLGAYKKRSIRKICKYCRENVPYPFVDTIGTGWAHAEPVKLEELENGIWRKYD